jgi:hypothetical protein
MRDIFAVVLPRRQGQLAQEFSGRRWIGISSVCRLQPSGNNFVTKAVVVKSGGDFAG